MEEPIIPQHISNWPHIVVFIPTRREKIDEITTKSPDSLKNKDCATRLYQPLDRAAALSRAASWLGGYPPQFVDLEARQSGHPICDLRDQLLRLPDLFDCMFMHPLLPENTARTDTSKRLGTRTL
ncbi:hypothetical protein N7481_007448 [Penicillium waksmanii]|uniref:uncharacterized protein n=1 Tax=Penicillium waksmanii TaxID=69791 RepID=UPI002547F1A0|nr:uncharacterized protein N7481_007448 [Penicillium waksmanii]KAJ5980150.1 hypothetical protein N7481_007448 [Penicillium waksmanii]